MNDLLLLDLNLLCRYFNLLGGDYGIKEEGKSKIEVFPDPENGYMQFLADWGKEDSSEAWTHPGMPNSHNYWYAKFDQYACFDLRGFSAIQFDLVAPANAEMTFVLTQKASNCSMSPLQTARLIDSQYQPLKKYITPDGTKQTLTLPLSDFAKNVIGQDFDMAHLKDFTIIDIKPNDFNFQLSNFKLLGSCSVQQNTNSARTSSNSEISQNSIFALVLFAALASLF